MRPPAKLANLASLVRSTNFIAQQLHFRVSENFTTEKEITFRLRTDLLSLSVVIRLGISPFAFDRSNAMLALSGYSYLKL